MVIFGGVFGEVWDYVYVFKIAAEANMMDARSLDFFSRKTPLMSVQSTSETRLSCTIPPEVGCTTTSAICALRWPISILRVGPIQRSWGAQPVQHRQARLIS